MAGHSKWANIRVKKTDTETNRMPNAVRWQGDQYGRIDLHIPDELKSTAIARAKALKPGDQVFAGMPVLRIETLDGVKLYLDNPEAKSKPNAAETWLLLRASGTEPLLRIYTESCSKESVAKLLESARGFAMGG